MSFCTCQRHSQDALIVPLNDVCTQATMCTQGYTDVAVFIVPRRSLTGDKKYYNFVYMYSWAWHTHFCCMKRVSFGLFYTSALPKKDVFENLPFECCLMRLIQMMTPVTLTWLISDLFQTSVHQHISASLQSDPEKSTFGALKIEHKAVRTHQPGI